MIRRCFSIPYRMAMRRVVEFLTLIILSPDLFVYSDVLTCEVSGNQTSLKFKIKMCRTVHMQCTSEHSPFTCRSFEKCGADDSFLQKMETECHLKKVEPYLFSCDVNLPKHCHLPKECGLTDTSPLLNISDARCVFTYDVSRCTTSHTQLKTTELWNCTVKHSTEDNDRENQVGSDRNCTTNGTILQWFLITLSVILCLVIIILALCMWKRGACNRNERGPQNSRGYIGCSYRQRQTASTSQEESHQDVTSDQSGL